jgi:hypothetical protein
MLITGSGQDNSMTIGYTLLDVNFLTSLFFDDLFTLAFFTPGIRQYINSGMKG